MIKQAATEKGAQLVVLPECFNSPYGTKYFAQYSEILDKSETLQAVSSAAKESQVFVVAGSIPERSTDGSRHYNTSTVFDTTGKRIAEFRKLHLFRINSEQLKFDEAEVLRPGQELTSFEIPTEVQGEPWKVGMGICFDIRFPELAMAYAMHKTNILVYPGAFNMVTGPEHWELCARARAVDSQQFVVLCSPARDETASYVAWGHSLVVDPWGKILVEMDEKEGVEAVEIDLAKIAEIRTKLPITGAHRADIFHLGERSH